MGKRKEKTPEDKAAKRLWNETHAGTGRPRRGLRRWDQKREEEGWQKLRGEQYRKEKAS